VVSWRWSIGASSCLVKNKEKVGGGEEERKKEKSHPDAFYKKKMGDPTKTKQKSGSSEWSLNVHMVGYAKQGA
jgi:hypothetical protein